MLQQTRVEAAIPYYERFLESFPTLQALADAPEERLLKLWEGLGYYSRARNLQKAARQALERYGALPGTASELASLAGIGPYTAGAVASIAFGEAVPAVDGNVLRVLARFTDDSRDTASPAARREAERALAPVIPRECGGAVQPGAHGAGRGGVPAERRAALRGLPAHPRSAWAARAARRNCCRCAARGGSAARSCGRC